MNDALFEKEVELPSDIFRQTNAPRDEESFIAATARTITVITRTATCGGFGRIKHESLLNSFDDIRMERVIINYNKTCTLAR